MDTSRVDVKTIGTLIDDLSILNIRIWMLIDIVIGKSKNTYTAEEIANFAKQIQELNSRRTQIVRAIDERLGTVKNILPEKIYG
jgi:RNA processing factor Prp31